MRKVMLLLFSGWLAFSVYAQQKPPKWMEKQKKAVVTITTYKADNTELNRGSGFFVTETGELVSAYSVFKDAARAEVKDVKGNVYPVVSVVGADELYDVIRLRADVPKKVDFLEMAGQTPGKGANAYLLPFSPEKVKKFGQGTVTEVTKLKDNYHYFELALPLDKEWVNAPVLTEDGKVFGLAQEDASGKDDRSFAVSAAYASSLSLGAADALNTTYTSIGIKKAWPENAEQAQVMLLLLQSRQDAKTYLSTLDDFIRTFPSYSDVYLNRASHYAYFRAELGEPSACLEKALADVRTYQQQVEKKSDGLYQEAKLIYGVAAADSTLQDPVWNTAHAQELLTEALSLSDEPLYHQLQADIYLNQGKQEEAFREYMTVNRSPMATPATWYMAAKIRAALPAVNIGEIITLLDSAVVATGTPVRPEAAPYVLERIDWKLRLMQYKEAIADYDLYYQLMAGRVNDSFYYLREQAKFRANDLDGALVDIREALSLSPKNVTYMAEEASVLIRKEQYGEALQCIDRTLAVAPDFGACYRLRGVCLVRQNQKAEACEAFSKAVELGDPVAGKLQKEYCGK